MNNSESNEQQKALIRTSAAVMMIFQIPFDAATFAVKRFADERHEVTGQSYEQIYNQIYELVTANRLTLTPDRMLARLTTGAEGVPNCNNYERKDS